MKYVNYKKVRKYCIAILIVLGNTGNTYSQMICNPSYSIPNKSIYNSWEGALIQPRGTIRTLNIFINIIYDLTPANDPCPSYNTSWNPSLQEGINNNPPTYLQDLIDSDYNPSNIHGTQTRLFHESSFGELIILGDFIVVNIKQSTIHSTNTSTINSFNVVRKSVEMINNYGGLSTMYGHDNIVDYDMNNDNKIDFVQIFIRNSSSLYGYLNIGSGFSGGGMLVTCPILINGHTYSDYSSTLQCVGSGNISTNPTNIYIHEISHQFFGGNNFHTSGGMHYGSADICSFIELQGGYGLMGSANSGLVSCNGYERWRMHWKQVSSPYYISASGSNSDIKQSDGNVVFYLRDFITYGDAIRIKLPYKDNGSANQYIWLENHQIGNNNKLDFLQYSNTNSCRNQGSAGIYAYYQIGKDVLSSTVKAEVYVQNETDNLKIISAEGNWDMEDMDDEPISCVAFSSSAPTERELIENPFCGYNDQQAHDYTQGNVINSPSTCDYTWQKYYYSNNTLFFGLPFLGDNNDAFMDGSTLNISSNPPAINTITCHKKVVGGSLQASNSSIDNKTIYLTGLSINIYEVGQNIAGKIYRVEVNWDDYDVTNDVRWTGKILLQERLNINSGVSLNLDQSYTPTQLNKNPNTGYFAEPTTLTCENASLINLEIASSLSITNNSSLILAAGSELSLENISKIIVKSGGSLYVKNGASIELFEEACIVIEDGAYFCAEEGAIINLNDPNSIIEIKDGAFIGINPISNISPNPVCKHPRDIQYNGNGTILFNCFSISQYDFYNDYVYSSDIVLDNVNYAYKKNIVISQNTTLEVRNSKLSFSDKSRIIIEKGAKLIIDNSILTKIDACEGLWRGIEVWGDNSQSQVTQGAQGILIMKNGAIIENAQEAVAVREGNPDFTPVWGTFGGIVRIKDCIFRNNRRSISFGSYDNFNPNTGVIINNLSYIINNVFTWDDALLSNAVPFSHISMWDVKGVKIQGNEFRNDDLTTYSNPFERGMGINSIDAEYQVQPRCVSLSLPCTSYDNNTFVNLSYGIKVENGDRNKSVVVNHSDFYNCYRSIYFKNMEFGEITNCNFDVAQEIVSGGMTNDATYGIYLDNCNAYEVEENNITSSNHGTYGIYIKASGDLANEIYNNNISGVEVATQAEGENGLPVTSLLTEGLEYRCNKFISSSFVDIAVTKDITTYQDGTIRKDQGSCANEESPANNMFSTPIYANIYLENMMLMNYYYSSGNLNLIPNNVVYPPGGVFNGVECNLFTYSENTSCPLRQHVNNDPITIIGTINQLTTSLQQVNSVIDGGNTEALLNLLNSSAADWQIKNELIAASPHLSEEVLIAMINRSPALPDWVIDQVLSANAPLTDNVFLSMVNRSQRLPDYIIRNLAIASSPLNTAEQLALINQTPVYPTWILRQILIENSPLFDEVLLALLNQDPSMENWAIRDVFMQNTPLSYDVEQALNNHFPAYPNWVLNGVYNSPYIAGEPIEQAQPLSPLLETYVEISNIEHDIALNTNELFRVYLHDTTGTYGIKDVVTYMEQNNLGKKANEISLACAYITSEENMKAQHKLDSLIQDSSLTDFCNYHSALITLNQSTPAILDTTTNTIITQAVETVAYSTMAKREKAGAESLLEFAGLLRFDESFAPILMMQKSSQQQNNTPKVADGTVGLMAMDFEEDYVKIYPNPNAGKFYVEYHIKDIEHGVFILQDVSGKEILRIDLNKEEEKLSVNKNLSSGVYIYQILLGECIYTKDKIVISEK